MQARGIAVAAVTGIAAITATTGAAAKPPHSPRPMSPETSRSWPKSPGSFYCGRVGLVLGRVPPATLVQGTLLLFGCRNGEQISNQIGNILLVQLCLQILGHQGFCCRLDLFNLAAKNCVLGFFGATQGDARSRFRGDHAGEDPARFVGQDIVYVTRFDLTAGIDDINK